MIGKGAFSEDLAQVDISLFEGGREPRYIESERVLSLVKFDAEPVPLAPYTDHKTNMPLFRIRFTNFISSGIDDFLTNFNMVTTTSTCQSNLTCHIV